MSIREMFENRKTIILKEPLIKSIKGSGGFSSMSSQETLSVQDITRKIDEAINDEKEAIDFYEEFASMLRRGGLKYFPLASDIETIKSDELDHLSRLMHLKTRLEEGRLI